MRTHSCAALHVHICGCGAWRTTDIATRLLRTCSFSTTVQTKLGSEGVQRPITQLRTSALYPREVLREDIFIYSHRNLVRSPPIPGIVRSGDSVRQVGPEVGLVYAMPEERDLVIRDVCKMAKYHHRAVVVRNRNRKKLSIQLVRPCNFLVELDDSVRRNAGAVHGLPLRFFEFVIALDLAYQERIVHTFRKAIRAMRHVVHLQFLRS